MFGTPAPVVVTPVDALARAGLEERHRPREAQDEGDDDRPAGDDEPRSDFRPRHPPEGEGDGRKGHRHDQQGRTATGANEATTATITPRLRHSSTVGASGSPLAPPRTAGGRVSRATLASIQGMPP